MMFKMNETPECFYPDDPDRVGDDDRETTWLSECTECGRKLFDGELIFEFDHEMPFSNIVLCSECLDKHTRIL